MAISLTEGYNIGLNVSSPGVKNFWMLSEEPTSIVPATGGPITAFETDGDDGVWYKFQCAQGEGDWATTTTAGSGGIEHTTTVNYRIGGLDEARMATVEKVMQSNRITIVAEHTDGKFFLLSRNGFGASGGGFASGTSGGGAAAIGATLTFTTSDGRKPSEVTVATTLDAITDA